MRTKTLYEQAQSAHLIRSSVGRYREMLAKGWSQLTAYPGTVDCGTWVVGNSAGQCGVSSLWLAKRLDQDFGVAAAFCRGSLAFSAHHVENISDHCWLEVKPSSSEVLALDLTCDQASGFEQMHIFESVYELDSRGIHYIVRDRLDVSDLPDSVLERHELLTMNLAQCGIARHKDDTVKPIKKRVGTPSVSRPGGC